MAEVNIRYERPIELYPVGILVNFWFAFICARQRRRNARPWLPDRRAGETR